MSVTAIVPITADYREVTLTPGEADNIRPWIRAGGNLYGVTNTSPAKILRINKADFTDRSTATFANDGKHDTVYDMVYCVSANRIYVLFAKAGEIIVSEVHPTTLAITDVIDDSGAMFGPGSICTDEMRLFVFGYDHVPAGTVYLAHYDLAGFGGKVSRTVTGYKYGLCIRHSAGKLIGLGYDGPVGTTSWLLKFDAVTLATEASAAPDYQYLRVGGDSIGLSGSHAWIGTNNGTNSGIIQRFRITDLGGKESISTGVLSDNTSIETENGKIWALFNNGVAVSINPDTLEQQQFELNPGQGYINAMVGDENYLYPVYDETPTRISRYHISNSLVKSYGGPSTDECNGVAVDRQGNIFICGYFYGTVNFGGADLVSAGQGDIFVVKLSAGGTHIWSRRFGGTGVDTATGLATDALGNVVVSGYFSGTITIGNNSYTTYGTASHALLFKLSGGTGDVLWSRRAGTTLSNTPTVGRGVAVDQTTGAIAWTGQYQDQVDFGGGPRYSTQNTPDSFLAYYNSDGVYQWFYDFSCGGFDQGRAVAIDASGNVAVCGQVYGSMVFNNVTYSGAGSDVDDIWVARLSSAGAPLWFKRWGGLGQDRGQAVAFDATGNVVLGGFYNHPLDFGNGIKGAPSMNAFVLKLAAANGALQWVSDFAHAAILMETSGVALDSAGNIYACGYFTGTCDFGGGAMTSRGSQDCFVVKLNSSGTHQWSKQMGGTSVDGALAIAADANQNALVVGKTYGGDFNGTSLTTVNGSQDGFLCRING